MLVVFVFHSQYFYHYDLIHQLQLQVYIYENKDQSKTVYCVCISSPSNASFIEFITVCSLVLITSCNVNPSFLLKLHDFFVLQFIIIFNAKSLRINLLYGCFIGSSINSYLHFLYSSLHFLVAACKCLCPNCCSTCF